MTERLHYVDSGVDFGADRSAAGRDSRASVVLLHPTPVDHGFWLPAAESFAPDYRVIVPDLPGHGHSVLGSEPLTMASMARRVFALLDRLQIQDAVFCGCSIGGYLLYELWRQSPERVRALAICSAKPHADTPEGRRAREATIDGIRQQGTEPFFRRMLDTLVGAPAKERDPDIERRLLGMMEPMTAEAVIAVQRALAERPDSRATAATIRVPTAVLAGALDTGSTPSEMRELATLIPGSRFYLLQEMGHYAPYEQPHLVGALLRRFADEVTAS
jgi:3-oxoadipate enol-lactonase